MKDSMDHVRGIVRIGQDTDGSIEAEIQGENQSYPAKFLMEPLTCASYRKPSQQLATLDYIA